MGRIAIAAGGAAIGFVLGGPAGISLGWTIGTLIGTVLFPPDPIKGPRIEDLSVQISSYGVPIPRLYGWFRASGNVIWATDLVEVKKTQTDGKGGPTTVDYSYYANFTVIICEGPAEPFRIWADSKLIWAKNSVTGEITSAYENYISWQRGDENNTPSPLHEMFDGVGNVPPYKGVLKIDFSRLPVKNFGNRIPNISVEVFAGNILGMTPNMSVELNWIQSTFEQTTNDQATMGIGFLDPTDTLIGSIVWASLIDTPSGTWTARSLSTTGPASTTPVTVRVYMRMVRRTGTNNDGYIDAITLTVDGKDITLTNPNAETGDTTGWTSFVGGLSVRNNSPLPAEGSWYFMGGTSPETQAYQDVPFTIEPVYLKNIVKDVCEKCQMVETTDFDVSALDEQTVIGYGLARQVNGRSAIEPLQQIYHFDGIETGGQLIWKYRDGPIVLTVDEEDLGTHVFGSERVDNLIQTRQQELELPYRVTVRYLDPVRDYQSGAQDDKRHRNAQKSYQELSIDVPIVLLPDDAKQAATKNLYLAWQLRTSYELSLPRKYLKVDPGDIISVPKGNSISTIYITETNKNSDGLLRFKGVSHDEILYKDKNVLGTSVIVPPQPFYDTIPIVFELMDGPLLDDALDPFSGLLVVAEGENEDATHVWPGGSLYRASPGSPDLADVVDIFDGSVMGTITTTLPFHKHTVVDRTNTVRVDIGTVGTLASVTYADFMSGANACMIGEELCCFMLATQISTGVYDLSILRRGIRGTEWVQGHSIGERFFLVDPDRIRTVAVSTAHLGIDLTYYGITFGEDDPYASTSIKTLACYNKHWKPLAPAHLRGSRTGNDLTITWIRRARMNFEWSDLVDAPLDEPFEKYILNILSGSGGILRTETIDNATQFVYTEAMQVTDFGSAQDPVTVQVCQVSSRIGNGYFVERDL